MIKINEKVIKGSIFSNDREEFYNYDAKDARERKINDRLVISYRQKCIDGNMTAFWDVRASEHTYMFYLRKTNTYYYTDDRKKAIEAYTSLLFRKVPEFIEIIKSA